MPVTTANLRSSISSLVPTNGSNQITAAMMRAVFLFVADIIDDQNLAGIISDIAAKASQTNLNSTANRINYVAASIANVGANTITANLADPSVSGVSAALTRGMMLWNFPWPVTNTGAVTLSIGGTTAVAVQDEQGNALIAGALQSGNRVNLLYTGSVWRVIGDKYRNVIDNALRPQRLQSIVVTDPNNVTASAADGGNLQSYTRGQFFFGKIGGNNSGAVTININGLGAKAILEPTGATLAAGRLVGSNEYLIQYDGTQFILWTPAPAPNTSTLALKTDLTNAASRLNYLVSSIANSDANTVTANLADSSVGGSPVSLTRGMMLWNFPWPATNTGAVTLSIGGTTAVAVQDELGNAMIAGALQSGDRVNLLYTGSVWRVIGDKYRNIWDNALRPQRLQSIVVSSPNAVTASAADGGNLQSYTRGQFFFGKIGGGNTGAVTININGLGAKSILEPTGAALASGRLVAGTEYLIQYDGTQFILWGPPAATAAAPDLTVEVTAANTKTLVDRLLLGAPRSKIVAAAALAGKKTPTALGWDNDRFPIIAGKADGKYGVILNPRELVNPAIWTGPAYHVDGTLGNDANTGLGAFEGDFRQAKRTIHSAFTAGNATGAPYRVICKPGIINNNAFSNNGAVEPNQHVAIIGWGGKIEYKTWPQSVTWTLDSGTTYVTNLSSVNRVFRTDQLTPKGNFTELTHAASLADCRLTVGTWWKDGSNNNYVNIGSVPGTGTIALVRNFNGARFLTHTGDLYLENVVCEGGITGALHCDAIATRSIVGVDCAFRYSSPSTVGSPLDAVQIRRTNGLVAFFNCDASGGAKDGWNFHSDANPTMFALLVNCTGFDNGCSNGLIAATSCNAITGHDDVIVAVVGGDFGYSKNGTEVHFIETSKVWLLGSTVTARDVDGESTAYKASNSVQMWLEDTTADAAGAATNYAIDANGGTVLKRNHTNVAGTETTSAGGSIGTF